MSVAAAAPSVSITAPDHAKVGEEIPFLVAAALDGVPALAYHWDFGDGTTDDGRTTTHSFTTEGSHTIRLVVDGLDGPSAEKSVTVVVSGSPSLLPQAVSPRRNNRGHLRLLLLANLWHSTRACRRARSLCRSPRFRQLY